MKISNSIMISIKYVYTNFLEKCHITILNLNYDVPDAGGDDASAIT